jgi:hypothetical protein
MRFIGSAPGGREDRAKVAGLAAAGPFIAVNTQQLKGLIGRCKSSINNGLQESGYLTVKTRTKSRECILLILPSLKMDPGAMRHWSLRFTRTGAAPMPIELQGTDFPLLGDDDLSQEAKDAKSFARAEELWRFADIGLETLFPNQNMRAVSASDRPIEQGSDANPPWWASDQMPRSSSDGLVFSVFECDAFF